jgi:excisionase family DNA binding protein
MDSQPPLEQLLDVKAVAQALRVHPQTVSRLVRSGRLPALRYARHWRFRRADVERWIAGQVHDWRATTSTANDVSK